MELFADTSRKKCVPVTRDCEDRETALTLIRNLTEERRTEVRRGLRVPAPGVDAYYSIGSEPRRAPVKNISPTGAYLSTTDRWPPGTTIVLTLKGRKHAQEDLEPQVRLLARVVRHGDDGVGMEFVFENVTTAEWLALFSKAASLTFENDPVRVFRITKAFAFLLHVASFAESEILGVITQGMSFERAERAIDIVLNAEMLMAIQDVVPWIDVPQHLIRQILKEGSRNQDERMLRYWAGMLASVCLDGPDTPDSRASAAFVNLLCELAPIHIRILDAAGRRVVQAGWEPGTILGESLYCTLTEIKSITGIENLGEIDFALDYLDRVGLLEMTVKTFGHDRINLTPTLLGLKFYVRCSGLASPLSRLEQQKFKSLREQRRQTALAPAEIPNLQGA